VGRLLDALAEVRVDPVADEVVGDGDLQPVVAEIQLCRVGIEPDLEALLSDQLGDRVRQPRQLRIGLVGASAAHACLLPIPECP
jgi:hypothetical protein